MTTKLPLVSTNKPPVGPVAKTVVTMETSDERQDVVKFFNRPIFTRNDFDVADKLSSGRFGHVYLARERRTHYPFACKVLHKEQLTKYNLEHQAMREIDIHSHLLHPNIVRMHNWTWDDKKVYIFLELCIMDVYSSLQEAIRFTATRGSWYFFQAARAIQYCHSKNVIHRDIKPENILIAHDGSLKVTDFGWSARLYPESCRSTFCGTHDYLPPEMLTKDGKKVIEYDQTIDIWALGVLFFEFLVGQTPFYDEDREDSYNLIREGNIRWPPIGEVTFAPGAKELISNMLSVGAENRPTFESILSDKCCDWISKMKEMDKAAREQHLIRYGGRIPLEIIDMEELEDA